MKQDTLKQLEAYDTATITNVVGTYPNDPKTCLGLYNPWTVNWYTDQRLRCVFPDLGPRAGYAVTVQYGMPDANYRRLGFDDVLRAIEASSKPVILVLRQNLPKQYLQKNGLCGTNMTAAMKALGCIGVVTDGPCRDIREIRDLDFQYLLTGVCAGHGDFAVEAVNIPVSVSGMDVTPGEIVHMDENGACKFPAAYSEQVLSLAEKLSRIEEKRIGSLSRCTRAEEVIRILGGFEGSAEEESDRKGERDASV